MKLKRMNQSSSKCVSVAIGYLSKHGKWRAEVVCEDMPEMFTCWAGARMKDVIVIANERAVQLGWEIKEWRK